MQARRGLWVLAPCVGQPPSARAGHTCATRGDVTYLFGGFDGSARLRDLHAYHHPSTHGGKGGGQWTAEVPEEDCPPARSSHSAVFSHNQMIVFGGYDGAKSLNDIQAYDVATGDWKELVGRGKAPSPRFGHSAVVYQHDKMYIFGGYDGVDRNDLYCFDFELMQWHAVLVKQGTTPPPRQYHSAVVYEDEMFVFGGKNGTRHYHDLHAFHFRTQTWRAITAESVVKPWPRAGHTAVAHGSLMLIFGGMNGKQNFNDLSVYSIRTNRWTVVSVEGELPAERRAHSAVISNGGHLCIFGGSDGTKRFDDIYSFDLSVLQKQFEEEEVSVETQAATTTAPALTVGGEEQKSFTPTTPPPKEWRQSRARTDTTPVPVSSFRPEVPKNEENPKPLSADTASAAAEERSQGDKQENGTEKGQDEDKGGSNAADKAHTKTESEETDRDERRKNKEKEKEKKRKEKSDTKRREKEEKELARRSRQINAAPVESGTNSEPAVVHGSSATNTASAATPPPAVPVAATDPSPSSSSSPASPAPPQTSAPQTSPKQHAVPASTSTPTTPVKLEERSSSRIALLKARFDASGSPTSGSPVRNLSRRSVAYPLSHQSSPSYTADNDVETRSAHNAEVEKLQKEMAELRSKLEERDREVAELKERMDARDAELRKVADGVAKQMRKMKRDLKKLKAEKKGKKSAAESSDDKAPKKRDTPS